MWQRTTNIAFSFSLLFLFLFKKKCETKYKKTFVFSFCIYCLNFDQIFRHMRFFWVVVMLIKAGDFFCVLRLINVFARKLESTKEEEKWSKMCNAFVLQTEAILVAHYIVSPLNEQLLIYVFCNVDRRMFLKLGIDFFYVHSVWTH